MSFTIPQLDLNPPALAGAYELARHCPWVRFTSGRRTLQQQAHAMACNVVLKRDFIVRTYIHGGPVLQLIVNRHPEWKTVEQLEHGLYDYLHDVMLPVDVALLSKHLGGDAFDVLPLEGTSVEDRAQSLATCGVIHRLTGLDKFLTREAGLPRWHLQFHPQVVENYHAMEA